LGLGVRKLGLRVGVWGLGFRVWGVGFGVWSMTDARSVCVAPDRGERRA